MSCHLRRSSKLILIDIDVTVRTNRRLEGGLEVFAKNGVESSVLVVGFMRAIASNFDIGARGSRCVSVEHETLRPVEIHKDEVTRG